MFAQWWLLTHRIDRFWVPLIPVVALLAASGCLWSSSRLWRCVCGGFVVFSVLFNLGFVTTPLCGFNAYLSDLDQARSGAENTAEGIHYLNQLADAGKLPRDATVLCVGDAQVFDARPRVLYNTVFNQPIFREWLAVRPAKDPPWQDWSLRPIEEVRRKFESEGVTHVLVNWQEILRYRMTYGHSTSSLRSDLRGCASKDCSAIQTTTHWDSEISTHCERTTFVSKTSSVRSKSGHRN